MVVVLISNISFSLYGRLIATQAIGVPSRVSFIGLAGLLIELDRLRWFINEIISFPKTKLGGRHMQENEQDTLKVMDDIQRTIDEVLKKPPQMTRVKRHVRTLINHSTPKKLLNFMRVELARKRGALKTRAMPYIIIVDTANVCNLKCPLCPTGLGEKNMTRTQMSFETFRTMLEPFRGYAYEVILHNWGEPFLNKEILKMIAYCEKGNIGTNLSTNLNILPFSGEDLVKSGLEYLIVSLDGTSQEVYSKYRVNGQIDKVYDNLQEIILAKKRLNSKTPVIEWQYLVMKHNLDEIQMAQKAARNIGVDLIRFIPVGLPFDTEDKQTLQEKWFPYIPSKESGDYIDDRFLQKPMSGGCFYLYRSVTITASGKVAPCCVVWQDSDVFGDLKRTGFQEIWQNNVYQSARSLFSRKKLGNRRQTTCCMRCTMFEKSTTGG